MPTPHPDDFLSKGLAVKGINRNNNDATSFFDLTIHTLLMAPGAPISRMPVPCAAIWTTCTKGGSVTALTRKQRELQAREQLFLDVARNIIRSEGTALLTMERIAEITEYSKGTVYKHFTCKEDLMCALCEESLKYMLHLSESMKTFEGHPRERLMIVALAYQAHIERFPEEFDLFVAARSSDIRSKASAERLAKVDAFDSTLMGMVAAQIQDAVNAGDLSLDKHLTADDLCFGPWALSYGILSIYQGRDLVQSLELPDPKEALFRHLNALLDGYDFKPLSHQYDYRETMTRAMHHLQPLLNDPKLSTEEPPK